MESFLAQHPGEDLCCLAAAYPQHILPSLAPLVSSEQPSPPYLLLQVQHAVDISENTEDRHRRTLLQPSSSSLLSSSNSTTRAWRGDDDDGGDDPSSGNTTALQSNADRTLEECEAIHENAESRRHGRRGGGGLHRCLKLLLTDGFSFVWGLERSRPLSPQRGGSAFSPLLPGGVVLGSILKISLTEGGSAVSHEDGGSLHHTTAGMLQRGVLRLSGSNTSVLPGTSVRGIPELYLYVEEEAKRYLRLKTGRPGGDDDESDDEGTAATVAAAAPFPSPPSHLAPPSSTVVSPPVQPPPATLPSLPTPAPEPPLPPLPPAGVVAHPPTVVMTAWLLSIEDHHQQHPSPEAPPPSLTVVTSAVVMDVTSDLHLMEGDGDGESKLEYDLRVLLVDPRHPSAGAGGHTPSSSTASAPGSSQQQYCWDVERGTAEVSLSNRILQRMIGVPASAFQVVSSLLGDNHHTSAPPSLATLLSLAERYASLVPLASSTSAEVLQERAQEWLEAAIQRVGKALEQIGEARFTLTYGAAPVAAQAQQQQVGGGRRKRLYAMEVQLQSGALLSGETYH